MPVTLIHVSSWRARQTPQRHGRSLRPAYAQSPTFLRGPGRRRARARDAPKTRPASRTYHMGDQLSVSIAVPATWPYKHGAHGLAALLAVLSNRATPARWQSIDSTPIACSWPARVCALVERPSTIFQLGGVGGLRRAALRMMRSSSPTISWIAWQMQPTRGRTFARAAGRRRLRAMPRATRLRILGRAPSLLAV
jgi:hypothetical protein